MPSSCAAPERPGQACGIRTLGAFSATLSSVCVPFGARLLAPAVWGGGGGTDGPRGSSLSLESVQVCSEVTRLFRFRLRPWHSLQSVLLPHQRGGAAVLLLPHPLPDGGVPRAERLPPAEPLRTGRRGAAWAAAGRFPGSCARWGPAQVCALPSHSRAPSTPSPCTRRPRTSSTTPPWCSPTACRPPCTLRPSLLREATGSPWAWWPGPRWPCQQVSRPGAQCECAGRGRPTVAPTLGLGLLCQDGCGGTCSLRKELPLPSFLPSPLPCSREGWGEGRPRVVGPAWGREPREPLGRRSGRAPPDSARSLCERDWCSVGWGLGCPPVGLAALQAGPGSRRAGLRPREDSHLQEPSSVIIDVAPQGEQTPADARPSGGGESSMAGPAHRAFGWPWLGVLKIALPSVCCTVLE